MNLREANDYVTYTYIHTYTCFDETGRGGWTTMCDKEIDSIRNKHYLCKIDQKRKFASM